MGRSVKKGPYVQPVLLKRVEEMNKNGEKRILKTWSRSSTIFPDFVGHTFAVHDGRKHEMCIRDSHGPDYGDHRRFKRRDEAKGKGRQIVVPIGKRQKNRPTAVWLPGGSDQESLPQHDLGPAV